MFFPLRFHNYNKKIKIEIMNSLQAIANTHQLYGIATEAFQFEKEGSLLSNSTMYRTIGGFRTLIGQLI